MSDIQTGIHIGKDFIEVVQVRRIFNGYQLIKEGKIEFSEHSDRQLSTFEIGNLLKRILQENQIEPINPITSLPDSQIILRYFTIPFLPPKERDNAIRFEAQKYIPFRINEVASAYFTLPPKEKKKELKVVFVATKKDTLEKHLEILREANIEPKAVEVPSLTLMRLLRTIGLLSGKNLNAIVNIEKNEAVITLCDQEMPYLVRDFSLKVTKETEFLEELGSEKRKENLYENLLREIQLSFEYHYKHFPTLNIEKIILVGKNGLEDWKKNLERDLRIPVVIAEPGKVFRRDILLSSRTSTAVGLALRGFLSWDKKVSFLEKKEEVKELEKPLLEEGEKKVLLRTILWELTIGLVIIFTVHIALSSQIKNIRDHIERIRKMREKVNKELVFANIEELKKILQEWNKKKNIFTTVLEQRIYLTPYLSELPRLLPEGVWLQNMHVDSKTDDNTGNKLIKLTLEGAVFSTNQNKSESDLVNELVSNIKNSPIFASLFKKVELSLIEKASIEKFFITHFRIICSN